MSKKAFTRREFIKSGTLIGSAAALSFTGLNSFASSINDTVRLGVIGSGNRGGGIARMIKNMPGVTITACCDISQEKLDDIVQHTAPNTKKYKDYRSLLDDKNVDAVLIASPEYLHYQMAIDALAAGKHIYLEKTITHNIAQTLELEKRVNQSNLVFQVGHQYRYFPLYQKVKEAIDNKWLGEVLHFECQYHRNSNWRKPVSANSTDRLTNWQMYREYSGGLMTELSAHQLDIVNWMTDSHPLKVMGMGGINYWKDGRENYDNVQAIFEYPGGVKANVSSILSNAYANYEIRILGTKGTVRVLREEAFFHAETAKKPLGVVDGVTGATIPATNQGKAPTLDFEYPDGVKRNPTYYAFLDFVKCVRENKKPLANIKTGKEVAIAAHMANIAIDTGSIQHWEKEYGG